MKHPPSLAAGDRPPAINVNFGFSKGIHSPQAKCHAETLKIGKTGDQTPASTIGRGCRT